MLFNLITASSVVHISFHVFFHKLKKIDYRKIAVYNLNSNECSM